MVQVRETARFMPDNGVEVSLFDQWATFNPERYDVAHLFGASFLTSDIALRLKHLGLPFVVSPIFYAQRRATTIKGIRSLSALVNRTLGVIRTDFDFTADVCQLASTILPNTAAEGELISKGLSIPDNKIKVVPNGVDTRFATGQASLFVDKYGLKDFVLNVGHIGSGRKNVLKLIEAVGPIDTDLVLIGKIHRGEYANLCLAAAERNPRVHIIESLPNSSDMLASAYAACRVFALPSLFETPGIAALEAALAGAAIVITPHGGTQEYFREDAEYPNPSSVKSIRSAIVKALDTGPPSDLSDRIAAQYAWPIISKMTADLYRKVTS